MITSLALLALATIVQILRAHQRPHTRVIRSSNTQVLSNRSIVTQTSHQVMDRRALVLRALVNLIGARREQPRTSSLTLTSVGISSRHRVHNHSVVIQTLSTKSGAIRADLGIFSVGIRALGNITRLSGFQNRRAERNLPDTLRTSVGSSRTRRTIRRISIGFIKEDNILTGNKVVVVPSKNANGTSNSSIRAELRSKQRSRSITIRGHAAGRRNVDRAITNLPSADTIRIQ
jgi:hypothetical protein